MKATLKFTLPDEKEEHKHAVNGQKYFSVLFSIHQFIRSRIKHGKETTGDQERGEIYEELNELLSHENINLYE